MIKRFVNFFYTYVIKPRSTIPDIYRKELILNSLLSGSIILSIWGTGQILVTSLLQNIHYQGLPLIIFIGISSIFICLLYLSRKGYVSLASHLFILLYFVSTTYGAYAWSPELSPIIISYILIIFISGILFSSRAGFIVFILVGIVILIIGQLQIEGFITPYTGWKQEQLWLRDIVQFIFMFFIITAISWLSNFEHERANKRARESEEALKIERDLLEIKVEQRTEQLKIAQAEKLAHVAHFAEFGRLSSGLFHDLAGPLSNIALNIKELEGQVHPDLPEIKKHLDLSISASKRLERLIMSIKRQLQFTDIKETFLLNDIVEDAITLLQYKALKSHVDIIFESNQKIYLHQNPLKFQQIVSNLLSNAIDAYTSKQSSFKNKHVTISLSKNESTIQLSVTDFGSGIPSEIHKKIFDPFFTTKAHAQGIGLGLTTVKEVVEKNFQGTITVMSKIGVGSTFTITFPEKTGY